jgi:hypothetical protein
MMDVMTSESPEVGSYLPSGGEFDAPAEHRHHTHHHHHSRDHHHHHHHHHAREDSNNSPRGHRDPADLLEATEEFVTVAEAEEDSPEGDLFPKMDSTDAIQQLQDDEGDDDDYLTRHVPVSSHPARSDWQVQLKAVALERQRRNVGYHAQMIEAAAMNLNNRRAGIHILVTEAYREAQRTNCTRVSRQQWYTILQDAMDDMTFTDNSALVMKNLSCMCIFVPGRQASVYGDNPEDRAHRIQRHQSMLERLRLAKALFLP